MFSSSMMLYTEVVCWLSCQPVVKVTQQPLQRTADTVDLLALLLCVLCRPSSLVHSCVTKCAQSLITGFTLPFCRLATHRAETRLDGAAVLCQLSPDLLLHGFHAPLPHSCIIRVSSPDMKNRYW